eukprot:TRINITY_DN12432_c0_g1_i14.p1 TRINITY_DN12432_c0_g1~~TRINITY_DN12432_c0_g1_i14.p1  ORF type:complete len:382 (-),score=73.86 TRINITY_DN12432_c0_g1_i14:160-1305(-)
MVFSTQLYKQLNYDNLGFYILAVTSFSNALMCLLSPGIVLSLNSKRAIVISSFGITLWVCGYILPFMCKNSGNVSNGMCNKTFIITLLLVLTFIGGSALSLFMVSIFSYVTSWSTTKDVPFFQSLFYAAPVCGKIVSSVAFSLTMRSPDAQTTFFICLTAVSLVTSILLIFLPNAKEKQNPLLEGQKPTFKQVVVRKTVLTLKLIVNKRMLLFIPFLVYLSFVKETKLGVLSIMLNTIMKGTDRLVINQRTGYIAICESIACVPFGVLMGKFVQAVGKRVAIYCDYILGLLSCVFVAMIFYRRESYGVVWYLGFISYAYSLGLGLVIQYSISATEFDSKEVAFGTATFINSLSSFIVLNIYSYFASYLIDLWDCMDFMEWP